MRDYQPKSSKLPYNLYRMTLYLIRDYDRLRRTYDDILYSSPDPPDGMPRSGEIIDSTSEKATTRATIAQKCKAIEQSLSCIPEEYRSGVLNNIMYSVPFPNYAGRSTWYRHKNTFIRKVAEKMKWK